VEKPNKRIQRCIIILTVAIVASLAIMNFGVIAKFLGYVTNIALPIIIGLILAFVLNVPVRGFENLIARIFAKAKRKPGKKATHIIAILLTFICIIGIFALLLYAVIPAVISAVKGIASSVDKNLPVWISKLEQLDIDTTRVRAWLSELDMQSLVGKLSGNAKTVVSSVISAASSTVSVLSAVAFGIIIAIYALLSRDTLCRQSRRLLYAYTKPSFADRVTSIAAQLNASYRRFFSVQCLEALILGGMIFLSFTLFRLPYAFLISLVTAVCALLPYIGSFISCLLAVLLTLLVAPSKVLICLPVYLVIQFIETQVIYPRVVGGSVGLSPLWTVIAALIGGKLFGVIGMIFAVPLVSVLYVLIKDDVARRLKKKSSPEASKSE